MLDDEALDELETALLTADVGVDATQHLLEDLRAALPPRGLRTPIRERCCGPRSPTSSGRSKPHVVIGRERPFVIMLAGVNGAGKTTSIGKLAKWLQQRKLSVLLAAGDTFRAAAREQLSAWGERNGVAVIQQAGGDPGAVMFDAVGAARSRGIDVVLADTAGRLPTQGNLMDELRKIKRVLAKARDGAPDEIWLVLDANTGQNALAQVRAFDAAVGLTGLDPDQARRQRQGRHRGRHRPAAPDSAQVHRRRRRAGRPAAVQRRRFRRRAAAGGRGQVAR